jgi:hypothetical protein
MVVQEKDLKHFKTKSTLLKANRIRVEPPAKKKTA